MSKIIVIKSIQSNLINISQVLRTDIEASNRGILALSSSGILTLVAWIKKKVLVKYVEDVADAMWQKDGISELIAACHSGALFRYALQQDTGLMKTLQLSAQSLLSLINVKDSSIKSLKSLRIWGHTKRYILLQPQPDRLVLMSTSSGSRPNVLGIIKTPNLQSAHIAGTTIIVQPCTGSDIYIHDATNCKTIEVVTLVVNRPGVSYIQWDCLACSFSATCIAVTDSERRLYIAKFEEKQFHGKRNGIKTYHLTPRQIVWPTAFQPSSLHRFTLSLSENVLSVFCSTIKEGKEEFFYFTYHSSEGGCLTLQFNFKREVSFLPGLSHELPDLFLTDEGLSMLTDKSNQIQHVTRVADFESLLRDLEMALTREDMDRISDIKSTIEEDLSIFLSSCNHMEGWVEEVEVRSKQHEQLVDTLLSHLTKSASEDTRRPSLLGLKELAKHHIKTLQVEMSNVLKYVDAEKIAQQLLVMIEQMNFYLRSVEAMKLPEGTAEDSEFLDRFEIWSDRPIKEILSEALEEHRVQMAEMYLTMKPWIYGQIETTFLVSSCVDIARKKDDCNLLFNMEKSYTEELKKNLFGSKDLKEIQLLEEVLTAWEALDAKELLTLYLVKYTHRISPHLITKPPPFWRELIVYENPRIGPEERDLTIGLALRWTWQSINLVLIDLFARVCDEEILERVEIRFLWRYLLIRKEEAQLLRWISHQICGLEGLRDLLSGLRADTFRTSSPTDTVSGAKETVAPLVPLQRGRSFERKTTNRFRPGRESLLGGQMYGSDTESVLSLDSSILEGPDESLKDISECSGESLSVACYTLTNWPEECFVFVDQSMIDDVMVTCYALREKILNILAQYGLFVTSEKNDPRVIIRRLFTRDSKSVAFLPCLTNDYEHRVEKSTLDKYMLESFLRNDLNSPFFKYFYANGLYDEQCELAAAKPWTKLVPSFQLMMKNRSRESVYNVCLEILSFFRSEEESVAYSESLSIFLTMLYAPNATLKDFLCTPELSVDNRLQSLAEGDVVALRQVFSRDNVTPSAIVKKLVMEEMPYLRPFVHKPASMNQIDIAVYDLLRSAVPFDIATLFTWQKYNKYGCHPERATQPSFYDEELSTKDGVKCSLDYYYYLKACRPTYALASILLNAPSPDNIDQLESIEMCIYGLALSSWPDRHICSACVALLLFSELNYKTLRTILFAADLIIDTLEHRDAKTKIHENLRKSQLNLLTQEVKGFLFRLTSLSTRQEAGAKLIALLEESIVARVSEEPFAMSDCVSGLYKKDGVEGFEQRHADFTSKEHLYFILFGIKLGRELSAIYRLTPPQKILEFLAVENRWLLFLVVVQLFQFPCEIVLKICSMFTSQSLREHLEFCLDVSMRISLVKEAASVADRIITESMEQRSEDEERERSVGAPVKLKDTSPSFNCSWEGNKPSSLKHRRKTRKKIKSFTGMESRSASALRIGSNYSNVPMIGSTETDHHSLTVETESDAKIMLGLTDLPSKSLAGKWETWDKKSDVFSIVLKCHKRERPAYELLEASMVLKSPILAVVAACYDSNLRMSCLNAWLYSSIPFKVLQGMQGVKLVPIGIHSVTCLEDLLNPELTEKLIDFYLTRSYLDILMEAFQIFEPNHLVLPFIKALECGKRGNESSEIFKYLSELFEDRKNDEPEGSESPESVSKLCIATICLGMDHFLRNRFLQLTFLQTILPYCHAYPIKSEDIDWDSLYKVLSILGPIETHVDIFKNIHNEKDFRAMVKELSGFLIRVEEYEKALEMANLINLDTADIFCRQLESEFESLKRSRPLTAPSMKNFLSSAYGKVRDRNVSTKKAALLFAKLASDVPSSVYSFLALQYAVGLACRYTPSPNHSTQASKELPQSEEPKENWWLKTEELELKMWCSFIDAKIHSPDSEDQVGLQPPEVFAKWPWEYDNSVRWLNSDDIERASQIKTTKGTYNEVIERLNTKLSEDISDDSTKGENVLQKEVESLIENILGVELVVTAFRIEQLFGIEAKSVSLMRRLLKEASTYSGSPDQKLPTGVSHDLASTEVTTFRLRRWSPNTADVSSRLMVLQRVSLLCHIASKLSRPYMEVIQHHDMTQLLAEVLSRERSSESLQLARELIDAVRIPVEDINTLFLVEVLAVINGAQAEDEVKESPLFLFTWKTLDQRWPQLLTLTETPSSIGHQLMDAFHACFKGRDNDQTIRAMTMSVEVIIRAHDCFSHAANMEGINLVLQAAPGLTKALLKHNLWSLLGRLLTGIKRYKEMSYIIDVMRDHQQFERLLERPSPQASKLHSCGLDKTLVHFLHSNYPQDREMLRMVALHFLMFGELAKMWEEEAEQIIKNVLDTCLRPKPRDDSPTERGSRGRFFGIWTDSDDNNSNASTSPKEGESFDQSVSSVQVDYLKTPDINLLTEAIKCYCFASQYCIQEKQLMTAMRHSRQAELIAVQVSLAKAASNGFALRVIKLSPQLVTCVITQHLSVREIVIVARSYGVNPDWSAALYFHYIRKGNRKFFDDFLQFSFMTTNIAYSIVKRIERNGMEPDHKERMKSILAHLWDVNAVYKIASQLDLRTQVEECLESKSACYLKDTVFNQGIVGSGNI